MSYEPITDQIHVYYSDQYPKGYTTAHSQQEAGRVAVSLVEATGKPWNVTSGAKHWRTGKPAFYTIFTEEDIPAGVFQRQVS